MTSKTKVVGLVGSVAAGKEVIKDALMQRFNCYHVALSTVIRAEIEKKNNMLTRRGLQDYGDEMRKKYGAHILAKLAVEYLPRDKEIVIVDGIRNPGEIEWLKKEFGKNFLLIAVDAPREVRFERVQKRARATDPKTWEEFVELDERDQGNGQPEHGQQTRKCIEQADFVIINDGDLQQFEAEAKEVVDNLWK